MASFVDVTGLTPRSSVRLSFEPAADAEILVRVLEEVIYLLEVRQVVPVRVELSRTAEGGLVGEFRVVPARSGRPVGSVPKAVTRHELRLAAEGQAWRCTVTVDV